MMEERENKKDGSRFLLELVRLLVPLPPLSLPLTLYHLRESVDSLCRDGTDMRGDAQNPKSFQAPRM